MGWHLCQGTGRPTQVNRAALLGLPCQLGVSDLIPASSPAQPPVPLSHRAGGPVGLTSWPRPTVWLLWGLDFGQYFLVSLIGLPAVLGPGLLRGRSGSCRIWPQLCSQRPCRSGIGDRGVGWGLQSLRDGDAGSLPWAQPGALSLESHLFFPFEFCSAALCWAHPSVKCPALVPGVLWCWVQLVQARTCRECWEPRAARWTVKPWGGW